MLGNVFARIVQFLIKRKLIFWSLFLLLLTFLIFGIQRLKIDKNIYSIFPKSTKFQQFSKVIQQNNLNKQLIFSFDASQDENENFNHLDTISEALKTTFSSEIGNIQAYKMVDQVSLISYLQTASIAYLDETDYQQIEQQLKPDSIHKKLVDVKQRLQGTASIFLASYYAQDPLNLFGKQMLNFKTQTDSSKYTVENGIVYSRDKKTVYFFADLQIDSKNNEQIQQFDDKLKNFVKQQDPSLHFDSFGVYEIALANAKQIEKDSTLTTIISIVLILLLLIIYYRSFLIPIFFLLPAGFGILSGLGLTGYINPEINAISIATASILLGIVLDYSFHFYTHFKHSNNIIETVKSVGNPLILGSFTTIGAFAALLFTDSVVLRNFGLIALLTLLSAAIFTLTFLPVIIQTFRLKINETKTIHVKFKIPRLAFRLALLGIIVLTTISLMNINGLNFDDDLNNLSYHPQTLKDKEFQFSGIQPGNEKKIYLFAQGKSFESAKKANEKLYQFIKVNQQQHQISELISVAPYLISKQNWQDKSEEWLAFWKQHPEVEDQLQKNATNLGFSETAFQAFLNLTSNQTEVEQKGQELIQTMGLNQFVHQDNGEHSILTSITIPKTQLASFSEIIRNMPAIYVLNISEMATELLTTVKNDFNFLLYFSTTLVFLSLIIVYGRIELALFAFFPMFLAWIWIIGITNLFDIQFNFVNIILTTFIFGLGDDYSIFITDGLIEKYKTNKNNIFSFKSAIILSGITTIIGTGVLIFAKHPAIHSIALISMIGIASVLLITLFVQPAIFDWFVTRRTRKKRGPITFFTFVFSILLYIYFFLGSLFLTILLIFIVIPTPIKKIKKQRFMNYLISKLAKSTLYAGVHVKKTVLNSEKLDFSKPQILIANHNSFLDILTVLMLSPKVIIMVKSWVYNSPIFGLFIRYAGYIFIENGTETNIELVQKQFEKGYTLAIFPEGTRSKDGEIHRFHKGAFVLSKQLNVPIQPIVIVGLHEINPKNDIMINSGEMYVQPLLLVLPQEKESDKDYTKRCQQIMREGLMQTRKDYAKSSYWRTSLIQNYVLKGPILEWYVRVKFWLECKNFDYYDEVIGERNKIYDIGCGYGYLSYFLHYRNPNREILGLDYDEEKILVAQHAIKKNDKLNFDYQNIIHVDFEKADVFFVNDVLHYLPVGEQTKLLDKIASSLNNGGVLFIRDGVINEQEKQKNTERTEQLSTKVFKFNKAEHELSFISMEQIQDFAQKNNFQLEVKKHSEKTSNTLFVLRKILN